MGGHLAAQVIANLASAVLCALMPKISFVSHIPTALRIGAGCGISMLISVLGMRSLGLLASDSFILQPFTWQSVSIAGLLLIYLLLRLDGHVVSSSLSSLRAFGVGSAQQVYATREGKVTAQLFSGEP